MNVITVGHVLLGGALLTLGFAGGASGQSLEEIRHRFRQGDSAAPSADEVWALGDQERLLKVYGDHIRYHVMRFWAVPAAFLGKRYETVVVLAIDRNGKIMRSTLRSSTNRTFDELVAATVTRAEPLPAAPKGMPGDEFEFQVVFSSQ